MAMNREWLRVASRISMAMVVVMMINYFVSFTNLAWLTVSAMLASFPTRGSPVRKGLIVFFILMLAIGVIRFFIPIPLHDRIVDVMLGVFIGTLIHFILPINLARDFRQGLVPVLQQLNEYLESIIICFSEESTERQPFEKRISLSRMLCSQTQYPEWIFGSGLNPGLRGGFRFYLVYLDHVIELLFVLDYQVACFAQSNQDQTIKDFMIKAMKINREMIGLLVNYFKQNRLEPIQSDYTQDIEVLEKELQKALPPNLELIDLSQHFLTLVAMVRNIKDTREYLLKLVLALPDQEN